MPTVVASHTRRNALTTVLLVCAVLAVYGQVYTHGFIAEYDDPGYVTENGFVPRGITWDGIRWAFTTHHMGHWNPLTWLSHMLDVQLFGLAPGPHHLVSVALHIANTLLLLGLLYRTTRDWWPSLIVATLFALHPLHVESVAWISERKDVLSTFMFLLTLSAYARYVEAGSWRWYAMALVCFGLGLMAKPMLVTVPFVLLLLDLWPLGRLRLWAESSVVDGQRISDERRARGKRNVPSKPRAGPPTAPAPRPYLAPANWISLLGEKVPFLGLTVLASVVAYLTQLWSGAIDQSGALPLHLRVATAIVAYARYLVMTLFPVHLAVIYPYDFHPPIWSVIVAGVGLAVISVIVMRVVRPHPYALVGWCWYLGTLVPVIGFVQIGYQALADRYTYIPLIGVFIMLVWAGRSVARQWAIAPQAVGVAASALIAVCVVTTWAQVGVWKTSETLFGHAVRVTSANIVAHNNLGVALATQDKVDAAIEQFQAALRIDPDFTKARVNLADTLRARAEAAAAAHPDDPVAHDTLGTVWREKAGWEDAAREYEEAIRLDPRYLGAHANLAGVLVELGRLDQAAQQYRAALELAPDNPALHFNLASTLARAERWQEAVEQYQHVVRLTPDDADAWGNLAMAHAGLRQTVEATAAQEQAVKLARAKGQWSLVQTMDDWLREYQATIAATPATARGAAE